MIATSPEVCLVSMSNNIVLILATFALAKRLIVNYLEIDTAQVQMISPPQMRGRISGLLFS